LSRLAAGVATPSTVARITAADPVSTAATMRATAPTVGASRVLFIAPNLRVGGAERQWSILLPGLRERGFDVRLAALDGGGPFLEPIERAGVPADVVAMRHQADLGRLLRSPVIRRFRPDTIVSRAVSGMYVGHALARLRHARHVYNEHRQVGMALSPRAKLMLDLLGRRVDLLLLVADDQATEWRQRGVPPQRIRVIANGVPVAHVADTRSAIRYELGLAADAVVVVIVAALRPEKRVADFVEAIRRARRSRPELHGVIVGDGPERPAIEAAAAETGSVTLLGQRDDVPRILQAADVFALTSEYEAAPMAILEAMASGLPVVATDVGGVRRVVRDGDTGLLIAPRQPGRIAAALARLSGDEELRRTLGRNGADEHRRHWDARVMVDRYAQILGDGRSPDGRRR
jgi:glycosyltransferase involved in cell wall biosynthesis